MASDCKDEPPVRSERDEFRLRPSRRKPRDRQPNTYLQNLARLIRSVAAVKSKKSSSTSAPTPVHSSTRQRCAVRLTYSPSRVAGHFAAHGRYLVRDKAAGDGVPYGSFGTSPLVEVLNRWQVAGDKRLFKVILSPEFGERVNLGELAKEFIARIERDLSKRLEWAAVNHFNTDHPHIHLVIRGVDAAGNEVRFPAPYIKESLRTHASAICTEQLGYRTLADVHHARQGEVVLHRFTSLDKLILKRAELCPEDAAMLRLQLPNVGRSSGAISQTSELMAARLRFLTAAGITLQESASTWLIPLDTESILRTMQNVADRQRMLARTGVAMSDDRLPHRITHLSDVTHLRGRVLGHVDNEMSGRVYMVLEGTDGAVHFLPHDTTVETHRAKGALKANHFISIFRGRDGLQIADLGDADEYLKKGPMSLPALPNEILAAQQRWKGWLGSFHFRLATPGTSLRSTELNKPCDRSDLER